jgi:hypothetical protein
MELNWQVSGAFANWNITMSTEPVNTEDDDDEEIEYRDDWSTEPFTRVYDYFRDLVNLLETNRQLEDANNAGRWVA